MDPNSFQFSLTIPGDKRLVGALRDLCAHAASYAQLDGDRGKAFAQDVIAATERVIAATGISDAPLAFAFQGDAAEVRVTISAPDQPPTCVSTTR